MLIYMSLNIVSHGQAKRVIMQTLAAKNLAGVEFLSSRICLHID